MSKRSLSGDEIAAHLGVNPGKIYKWITRKRIPAHQLGWLRKFLAAQPDAWVKAWLAPVNVPSESSHVVTNRKPTGRRVLIS